MFHTCLLFSRPLFWVLLVYIRNRYQNSLWNEFYWLIIMSSRIWAVSNFLYDHHFHMNSFQTSSKLNKLWYHNNYPMRFLSKQILGMIPYWMNIHLPRLASITCSLYWKKHTFYTLSRRQGVQGDTVHSLSELKSIESEPSKIKTKQK